VDDEPAIRLMADRGLALHGYSAATFENAHDLLGHLEAKSAPFDLIITDHTMPGMTGLELIRHLRKSSNTAPIIILSGNARYVTAEDLAGLGEVQFMPKPFDLGALLERIAVALALRNNWTPPAAQNTAARTKIRAAAAISQHGITERLHRPRAFTRPLRPLIAPWPTLPWPGE
jgi:DNA-binding NtrC family response regulator